MCRFSIVVPVYNVEDYIDECLQSVLIQTYQDYEIILVNDGSTDSSGEKCDAWANRDSRINVIHQENKGQSAARNTAIRCATGEYIVILDSDDYLENHALQTLADCVEEGCPDIVLSGVKIYDENTKGVRECKYQVLKHWSDVGDVLSYYSNLRGFIVGTWCITARREFILKKNLWFYPGIKHEDELWIPQTIVESESLAQNPQTFYCYREHRNGSTMNTCNIQRMDDSIFVIDQLLNYASTKSSNVRLAIQKRCVKLMTGVICNLYNYRGEDRYKELTKKVDKRIKILKFENKAKYRILYLICSVFGSRYISNVLAMKRKLLVRGK